MSKNKKPDALVPFQIKMRPEILERIETEAAKRGMSRADIIHLALQNGLPGTIAGLDKIVNPEPELQHA